MSRARTRDLIAKDEGRKKKLYKDSRGYWTIGVGRLLEPTKGGRLSEDEIDYLFKNDLKSAWEQASILPWFADLNHARKAVIVSMCYQLGGSGVRKFKHMIRDIKRQEYAHAAIEMKASIWHTQTPARCKRLAKMMATGSWPEAKAKPKPKPKKTAVDALTTRSPHH
jgi:lysozyme